MNRGICTWDLGSGIYTGFKSVFCMGYERMLCDFFVLLLPHTICIHLSLRDYRLIGWGIRV